MMCILANETRRLLIVEIIKSIKDVISEHQPFNMNNHVS